MNMSKTVAVLGTALLMLLIICGTVLVILGKDADVIFTFAASTVIPTATILYFGNKVEKTQETAEKTMHQTNGRMTELIALLRERGVSIPEEYQDLEERYAIDENGKAYLRKDIP